MTHTLHKNKFKGQGVWWDTPVIPATKKAEIGGSQSKATWAIVGDPM
jgi:hypothetical protein